MAFSLTLLAVSLMTAVPAWNPTAWKVALIAGEFGHYLALVALVVICVVMSSLVTFGEGRRDGILTGVTAGAALVAMGFFLSPAFLAAGVARMLPGRLTAAFGANATPVGRVLDFERMLWPRSQIKLRPVTTHIFAPAGGADREVPLALDFYEPLRDGESLAPCVIVIHGGGWDRGDRTQLAESNHWLAGRGFAVAAVSYRLAPAHRWPAQREDVVAATQWLQAHAAELGIDGNRLVLLGRSAGAQVASAVGYGWESPAIRGVIGLYGVYDMDFVWSIARSDDVLNSVKLMTQYLGGAPALENAAAYASASAQALVRPGSTPPTLLLHGTKDTLCWAEHSRRLAERLDRAGVPHVMVELPWATHAFDFNLHGPGGQITRVAVEGFLRAVLDEPR